MRANYDSEKPVVITTEKCRAIFPLNSLFVSDSSQAGLTFNRFTHQICAQLLSAGLCRRITQLRIIRRVLVLKHTSKYERKIDSQGNKKTR